MDSISASPELAKGQHLITEGRFREAILVLAPLRDEEASGVQINTLISTCLLKLKKARASLRYSDRALLRDPCFIPALINRVKGLQAERHLKQAQLLCKQILSKDPGQEEVWELWCILLQAGQESTRALEIVAEWLRQYPENFRAYLLEGRLHSDKGNQNQAINSFAKALRINSEAEAPYADLSVVMLRLRRYNASLQYLEKALDISPRSIQCLCRKARLLWLMGYWREASTIYGKASSLQPDSAILFLNQHLIIPGIPADGEDIKEARQKYLKGLSLAESNSRLRLGFEDVALPHTFELAYHNKEDRWLLERYINLMRKLATPLLRGYSRQPGWQRKKKTAGKQPRIRIGFISQFFSAHSNSIAIEGLIRHLDREIFEVVLIHTANSKSDCIRDILDACCDQSHQLSPDFAASFSDLHGLELDILYFTDLGMNPNDYVLPFFRSAPIQMTGWGIPHTSGMREIDYYVSTSDLEAKASEHHYTETLVKLPGGLPCCFDTTSITFSPLPRDYFLLPPANTLVGCLQGLHKMHPDFDAVLEEIAQQNPEVGFVFIEDSIESRTRLFLDRLSRTAPSVRERCATLSSMNRDEYRALCHCLDLLLDPIYYGSGISFFEAAFVGTPIVTMEGVSLRSRVVACGYREMKIADPPITQSIADYISLTSALVQDQDCREVLRSSIRENNQQIFNRLDYVRNFETFCIEALKSRDKP